MLAKGQAILFNRFTWLYLLLCFPFIDYILRNIIPLPIVSSLWDEALLLLLIGISIWRWLETNRKLPSMRTPLLAFIVLGLAFFVFNMHYISINIEGFRAVYQYILALFIGFFLLNTREEAERVVQILILVATGVGLYGVYQYVVGVEVPMSWLDSSEIGNVRTRSFSIVQSPNVLGSYMILMSPIAIGMALKRKGLERFLWIACALVMLAALLFSGSRGAWFAFAGAIGVIFMLMDRRLFIAFTAAAILAALFVPQVSSRLEHLFSPQYIEKSSSDGRIARWLNAYDMMRSKPGFGLGLGRYGGAVGDRHFGTTYVDSYYFKTLAEIGLIGLSLYLWLMFLLFKNGYDIWRKQKGGEFFLYGGILAGLLSVIMHNAVENIFEVPFMNTFFWLLAGVLLSLPYLTGGKEALKQNETIR